MPPVEGPGPQVLVVMAGGQGRRMGRDKAQVLLEGVTLLGRAARAGEAAGLRVLVVGRERQAGWDGPPETEFLLDEVPGQGPLGGIAAALRHVGAPLLAVGCDMPALDGPALAFLQRAWPRAGRAHGLVGRHGDEQAEIIEPLFAVYAPAALPLLLERLAAGRRSLRGLIDAGDFGRVDVPAEILPALRNVNTPQDLW